MREWGRLKTFLQPLHHRLIERRDPAHHAAFVFVRKQRQAHHAALRCVSGKSVYQQPSWIGQVVERYIPTREHRYHAEHFTRSMRTHGKEQIGLQRLRKGIQPVVICGQYNRVCRQLFSRCGGDFRSQHFADHVSDKHSKIGPLL